MECNWRRIPAKRWDSSNFSGLEIFFDASEGDERLQGNEQTHEYNFAGTYLKHIDQCFGKGVQCEFHFGEDYQIRLALNHWE